MNTEDLIDVVMLLDEEGKEVAFDHLLTFKHLGRTYIALSALDETQGLSEDEVLLLEIVSSQGEDTYVPIENEVLLEEVFATFLELFVEYIEEMEEES